MKISGLYKSDDSNGLSNFRFPLPFGANNPIKIYDRQKNLQHQLVVYFDVIKFIVVY